MGIKYPTPERIIEDNLSDELRLKIVREELNHFKKLVEGHQKLLTAIGNL